MYNKIIHVDMDAFYTSVEELDNPYLKGKPIVVGGSSDRGVVAAASYQARCYGIRSAMSSVLAKKKYSKLIFIKPRFDRYKEISNKVRNIFFEFTDLVEPLSLDEAFLDVTVNKKSILLASKIATSIRSKIKKEIGLTASAGISINKFTAKVATEINKPNGQKTIHPDRLEVFLNKLAIDKFFGVGKVTAKKMNELGIYNGFDLRSKSLDFLEYKFGKMGKSIYEIVRGRQDNPVNPNRLRKSVGAERTFNKDIRSEGFMIEKLKIIATEVEERLSRIGSKGKTITIKIKYYDFNLETRSRTISNFVQKKSEFFPIISALIYQKEILKPVRLLGISISSLVNDDDKKETLLDLQCKFDF
ncbi:MAG: DNA polymerase IV [Candidatus Neomarinimicrobiota bacterium]